MSSSADQIALPNDSLLELASRDVQQQAARLVQEAFAAAFRLSVEGTDAQRQSALQKLGAHLTEWSRMAPRGETDLRMAMLLAGLDQWGLAFSHTFGAAGLQGLSELVGVLRDSLDVADEANCQAFFAQLNDEEEAAFDFKVLMRRELHLALWHAMIAAESREDADNIVSRLGGLILGLQTAMPRQGWRLIADALASIQMRCLSQGIAIEGMALETTQSLFASLAAALPETLRDRIMQQSTEAVRAWQLARRGVAN